MTKGMKILVVAALAALWPCLGWADGIQNGDFEMAGPAGGAIPSADGWQQRVLVDEDAPAAARDRPAAEGPGAGGAGGLMRIGDDPATPAPALGPKFSGIRQEFACIDKDAPRRFCNITFQSAYTAAPGETAFVTIETPAGVTNRMIPAGAVLAPHGVAVPGCYRNSVIAFGVASNGATSDSTLYIDKVDCSCDDKPGMDDLPPLEESGPSSLLCDGTLFLCAAEGFRNRPTAPTIPAPTIPRPPRPEGPGSSRGGKPPAASTEPGTVNLGSPSLGAGYAWQRSAARSAAATRSGIETPPR